MKTASMKPEVALLDNEDMEEVSGDIDWQFVSLGEQQNFGIRTAGKYRLLQYPIVELMMSIIDLLHLKVDEIQFILGIYIFNYIQNCLSPSVLYTSV